jgi:hypothetical protein
MADAGEDATRPTLGPLGDECVIDADCEPGLLCGTTTILTTTIVPSTSKPVCTKPCCTSEDCPAGFVCFGPGTGGSYCVAASRAMRTPPDVRGKTGGEICQLATECRSGLCLGRCNNEPGTSCSKSTDCKGSACVGFRCADTCCEPGNCASGSVCRVMIADTHSVWACGEPNPSPAKDQAATCIANQDCKNDNCVVGNFPNRRCTPTCCSAADCTALGFAGNVCAYGQNGNDRLKWCFEPNPNGAAKGTECTLDAECSSRYCDFELRKCLTVCCTDADCAATEQCRPTPAATPLLRCVPRL